jgi:UDP-N-acetylmuramate--alanine ligase
MAQKLFFCGIGGSGMSALALIMQQRGFKIVGSDRSYDQGHTPEKFAALAQAGIALYPQDGSGVSTEIDSLVVSSAVEETIPDIIAARAHGIAIRKRADLLAEIFNQSEMGVSVAGTSGKSTVTGMIAHVLTALGRDPTVMNGAVIKSLGSNMRVGAGPFVTETDESDGTIALYNPAVAVVNNITLDHKSMEELEGLFGDFITRARRAVVLNFDDERLRKLASRASVPVFGYSLADARSIKELPYAIEFQYENHRVLLNVPGLHNIANALACLCVCKALGIDLAQAAAALSGFTGIQRRMDVVGHKNDITVIDDFGHNPDKIDATLGTLKKFPGRLIVMFQPHGFGPLKLMGREIAQIFSKNLTGDDLLFIPEPYYAGGTVDRSVTSHDIVNLIGSNAKSFATRAEILPEIIKQARAGDRVIIMGARDDTLSVFAQEILKKI